MDHNSLNIDQHVLEAYLNTVYTTEKPKLSIKIGEINHPLNVFLFDNNSFYWAFVSASNPCSAVLSDAENDVRHKNMIEKVKTMNLRFCEGLGIPSENNWKDEKSLLILDISKKEAMKLGKAYNQNAIVYGKANKAPELLFCNLI
jgi:uncharacterized protein DUF3293